MTEKKRTNLIPNSERTPSELRKQCSNGGKRSGEVRRAKKTMREALEMLLNLPIKDEAFINQLKEDGIIVDDMTNNTALMYVALQKAMGGDTQAMNFIRDTSGQKPREEVDANVKTDVTISVTWDD